MKKDLKMDIEILKKKNKQTQIDILEMKSSISQIKHKIDNLFIRLDKMVNKLEGTLIDLIERSDEDKGMNKYEQSYEQSKNTGTPLKDQIYESQSLKEMRYKLKE
jgi:hypothetical protein